jgi:HD-like signal output (HDOD) protein
MPMLLLCPADLEAYLRDLPVAAAVLPRLQMLLLSDETNLDEVVELVRFDPSLATRVMHAAGSAYYGRARDVGSLGEAIALLGMREAYGVRQHSR